MKAIALLLFTLVACGFAQRKTEPLPEPSPVPLEKTYVSIYANIIYPKCMGCHGNGTLPAKAPLYPYEALMAAKNIKTDEWFVEPGWPSHSRLAITTMREACSPGAMPPKWKCDDPLTYEEQQLIGGPLGWIAIGAPKE